MRLEWLLLVLASVYGCVAGESPDGDIESLKMPEPQVLDKPPSKARAGSEKYGYQGNKPVPGKIYKSDDNGGQGGGGDAERTVEVTNNVVLNNVALIHWLQADEGPDPSKKHMTVGALIATNAIVCMPSVHVPVKVHNSSNYNVHEVNFVQHSSEPHVISGKEVVVAFHPAFSMDRDGPSRLALVLLKTPIMDMYPIAMVAVPFLPTAEVTRHDDYSLANCMMVAVNDDGNGVTNVPMSAVMCRHGKKAKDVFRDKVCGYAKMVLSTKSEAMVRPQVYPRDVGSPLICGNLLVGVYAGIQNLRGTYHKEAGEGVEQTILIGGQGLSSEEQYTFDIPGAPRNYEFLSGFSNEEATKMRWEQSLNLKQTSECLITKTRQPLEPSRSAREDGPLTEPPNPVEPHTANEDEGEAQESSRSSRGSRPISGPGPAHGVEIERNLDESESEIKEQSEEKIMEPALRKGELPAGEIPAGGQSAGGGGSKVPKKVEGKPSGAVKPPEATT